MRIRNQQRIALFAVLALYVAQRLWVVLSGRCLTDMDEAIIGVMALEILRGDFTPFFHGQDYMGTFQSFAAVPFIVLCGPTALALRLTAIVEGIGILLAWRWLWKRWERPAAWWAFALLFALAPEFLTVWTLKSRGGYVEVLLLGSLWLCFLSLLQDSPEPFRRRPALLFLFGLATGLGWYMCQFMLFFYLPATLHFLLFRSNRDRIEVTGPLASGAGWRRFAVWATLAACFLTLAFLMLRGTLPPRSHLSAWIYRNRWLVFAMHGVAIALYGAIARRTHAAFWPLAFGFGVLVGYVPALSVLFAHEGLYNTAGPACLQNFFTNIGALFLLESGALIGLLDYNLQPIGAPRAVEIGLPLVYILAAVMLGVEVARRARSRRSALAGETFLLLAAATSTALTAVILQKYVEMHHYALFFQFFATMTLAWFLGSLWTRHRAIACLAAFFVLGANVFSVAQRAPARIVRSKMILPEEQEIIDFLLDRDITMAATSLGLDFVGFKNAYLLSFVSNERLRIHAVLHIPRLDRYREELRKAERCAIVTERPTRVESALRKAGIAYRKQVFGNITVIYDFDKARVDALGLINYNLSFALEDMKYPLAVETETGFKTVR